MTIIGKKTTWLIFCLFLILTIIMTFPLILNLGSQVRDYGDSLLNTWILTTVANKIARFDFKNFFAANIFYPEEKPLLFSELLIPQAIVALPIIRLTGNPLLAHNLILLLALLTSALGMFFLAFYLSQEFWPSFVAGIVFAFSPFMIAHTFQVQVLSAGGLPLSLLFLHRYFRQRRLRDWLAFTFVYIVQSLANMYYALFMIIFSGLFIFFGLIFRKFYRNINFWGHLLLFLFFVSLCLGPIFFEYAQQQQRTGFERSIGAEARITSYLATAKFNRLYGQWSAQFRWPEGELFPGFIPFILALVGAVFALKKKKNSFQNKDRRGSSNSCSNSSSLNPERENKDGGYLSSESKIILFYLLIGLLGVWFSFGSKGPFWLFHRFVPGFKAIRAVPRFHIYTMLALSLLTAFGLVALIKKIEKKPLRAILIFFVIGLITMEYFSVPLPLRPVVLPQNMPLVYQELAQWKEKRVILELPFPEPGSGIGSVEGLRMYCSLFHGHHLVNGYSGFFSPTYIEIRQRLNQQSLEENILFWKNLGINLVIIHCEEMGIEDFSGLIEALEKFPYLRFSGKFAKDLLFSLL